MSELPKVNNSNPTNPLISKDAVELLNFRIQQEELSSRIYMSMAMWLTDNGYQGAGSLWRKYSDEELTHADKAREYLLSFGIQPRTPMLEGPSNNYIGLPDIIRKSFNHEITVSKQCKDLASRALKEGDHMLYQLALWYLKEQVEEHDKMQNWIDRLEAFGEDKTALRFLDNEMGG